MFGLRRTTCVTKYEGMGMTGRQATTLIILSILVFSCQSSHAQHLVKISDDGNVTVDLIPLFDKFVTEGDG